MQNRGKAVYRQLGKCDCPRVAEFTCGSNRVYVYQSGIFCGGAMPTKQKVTVKNRYDRGYQIGRFDLTTKSGGWRRAKLCVFRANFCKIGHFQPAFGFSPNAIKHWEGGRRTPEAPARTLLTVIDKNPVAVLTALDPGAFAAAVGSPGPTTRHLRIDRKRETSRDVTRRKAYSAEAGKNPAK